MRILGIGLLLVFGSATSWGQHIAKSEALSPEAERATFKVPAGFEVQLVAAEPQIGKPIQIAFDHKGRLWVTTSRHYPFAAAANEKPSDKLYILSDFGPDGRAKTVTTFADDLNIPIGILPLPDGQSCLVSHIGHIIKLTDTNGDGKADQRETILSGFGSKDTHGMMNSFVLLPDGWVYACHGFANESTVTAKDGSKIKMQSGHTFRFKPDGSRVEPWTFGQVNPFGMTVDPYLNLYTADCHSKPITQLIRGSYYDSFGKPHDGLGYGPHVTRHDHGSTALCGLAWYEANHFPKEWNGCLFLGNVVTNRINADRIEWVGATPVAKELPDFLTSSDPWFRPTDIKLGPDGALYFADFYNRIIGHYEVDLKHPLRDKDRGRVWRIVWKGANATTPKMPERDLIQQPLDFVANLLTNDNITVRMSAANDLARRLQASPNTKPNIADPGDITKVTTAVGLYCLAGEPHGSSLFDVAGYDNVLRNIKDQIRENPTAFTGLMIRAIGTRPSWGADERGMILMILKELTSAPHITRAAIDGILTHPHAEFIPPLVSLLEQLDAKDNHTRHAVRIAIRNSLRAENGWRPFATMTTAQAKLISEIALGVSDGQSAKFLLSYQKENGLQSAFCEHISRFGDDALAAELIQLLQSDRGPLASRIQAFGAFAKGLQYRGAKLPMSSKTAAIKLCEEGLATKDSTSVQLALEMIGAQKLDSLTQPVVKLIAANEQPENTRLNALSTLFMMNTAEAIRVATLSLGDNTLSLAFRQRLAQQLGQLPQPEARNLLVTTLSTAPAQLASAIALSLAQTPPGADALLATIEAGKASPRLLQDQAIATRLISQQNGLRRGKLNELLKGLPSADAKLEQTLRARLASFQQAKPDLAEGKKLFTTKCAICHQLGGEGAKVGPNLDGVAQRGPERLLEDILDPNRNVDAAFRSMIVNMADGRTFIGQVLREEGEIVLLADAQGKEQRLVKKEIEKKTVSPLSVMPANFHEMPEQELFHILGFLLKPR